MAFPTRLKLVGIVAATLLSGCATQTKPAPQSPHAVAPPTTAAPQSGIAPGSAEDLRVNVGDTVHFAYDKSVLTAQDKMILQRQATWLERYPAVQIIIQGNCDPRGTREYNLALGASRANSVKDYLLSQGISGARIETISYGKERPVCVESTESCWARDRRAVTVVISGGASS